MIWLQSIKYTIQWSDPRLFNSSCAFALAPRSASQPSMVSLSKVQARSENARDVVQSRRNWYWLPTIEFPDLRPGFDAFDDEVTFDMNYHPLPVPSGAPVVPKADWLVPGVTPQGITTEQCEYCVTWQGEVEVELKQVFDYWSYPFDEQTVNVTIQLEGMDLYTCDGVNGLIAEGDVALTSENVQEKLFEVNSEWRLHPMGGGDTITAVNLGHPMLPGTSNPRLDTCVIQISIKRPWIAFLLKNLASTILVVLMSLVCALLLHPVESIGDRTAVLFIAFLILVTNMQTDLGLGVVPVLLWLDVFNLMQLVVVIVVLIETMVVYAMIEIWGGGIADMATHLDYVSRRMLLIMYVLLTICLMLVGTTSGRHNAAITLIGMVILGVLIAITYVWTKRKMTYADKRRAKALVQLSKASIQNEEEWRNAVHEVFFAFDNDNSGELELDEMRELVIMLHPSATKPDVRKAMLEVRKFTDSDGKLDEPNFADALVTVEEFMIKTLGDAVYSQERSLAGERITDLGGKIRLRGSVQGAESPKTRLRNKSSFVGRLIKAGSPSASKSAIGQKSSVTLDVAPELAAETSASLAPAPPPPSPPVRELSHEEALRMMSIAKQFEDSTGVNRLTRGRV